MDIVSIDVEVLDDDGNLVQGLTRDDFIVEENGKEVKIVNFARYYNRPVSLALLLDTSTIELSKLNIAKQFLLNIIHLLDRNDDICLYSFDERDAYMEADYTTDRAILVDATENITVTSKRKWGFMAEFFGVDPLTGSGIDRAIRSHRESAHPKKALLIISNRFRGLGPATVDHIQASRCTLYALGFDNKSAVIASMGGDAINKKQLMKESGGRKFSAETRDVMGVSRKIVSSMKNYYSIGYQTESWMEMQNERRIEVRIPDRDYTINARRTITK
ncbi:MAG: VWA domain-containing protein [Acidobacteria bacterium]|nr:VWA domain-containing protein [Acidobacteriota bacterium]